MAKKPAGPDPWNVAAIEAKAPDEKSVKDARKVLTKGGFGTVEPRADGLGWWVICKGLTGSYEVSVKRGPRGGIESRCTCPNYKRPCKHALALLLYLAEHPEPKPEGREPESFSSIRLRSSSRFSFSSSSMRAARRTTAPGSCPSTLGRSWYKTSPGSLRIRVPRLHTDVHTLRQFKPELDQFLSSPASSTASGSGSRSCPYRKYAPTRAG